MTRINPIIVQKNKQKNNLFIKFVNCDQNNEVQVRSRPAVLMVDETFSGFC